MSEEKNFFKSSGEGTTTTDYTASGGTTQPVSPTRSMTSVENGDPTTQERPQHESQMGRGSGQGQTVQIGGTSYSADDIRRFQEAFHQMQVSRGDSNGVRSSGPNQNQAYGLSYGNGNPCGAVRPFSHSNGATRAADEPTNLGAYGWSPSTIQGRNRRIYFPPEEQRQQPDDDDELITLTRRELHKLLEEAARSGVPRPHQRQSFNSHQPRGSPSTPSKQPKQVQLVKKPSDLRPLGKYEKLERGNPNFKVVASYVQNSHDIDQNFGSVKIHDVYEFQNSTHKPAHKTQTPSKGSGQKGSSQFKMLLFYKTSPKGIQKLSENRDTCIAFYDRVARAFAVQPRDLRSNLRQIILLCSVSLGKKHDSSQGWNTWSKKGYPPGCDSVKGHGKLTPVWDPGNKELGDGTIVPCGRTKEHGKYKSYELEYSEYVVWEVRRVRVRFAVDIEVELNEGPEERGGGGRASSMESLLSRFLSVGSGGKSEYGPKEAK